eukprot:766969-Hanusia_phi.AAC.4
MKKLEEGVQGVYLRGDNCCRKHLHLKVLYHQLCFQTVRMIEIDVVTLFRRQVRSVTIIVVVRKHSNVLLQTTREHSTL